MPEVAQGGRLVHRSRARPVTQASESCCAACVRGRPCHWCVCHVALAQPTSCCQHCRRSPGAHWCACHGLPVHLALTADETPDEGTDGVAARYRVSCLVEVALVCEGHGVQVGLVPFHVDTTWS